MEKFQHRKIFCFYDFRKSPKRGSDLTSYPCNFALGLITYQLRFL